MQLKSINVEACVKSLLESLKPELPTIQKIILFGSAARGEETGFSDLDVVIIKETEERFVIRSQKFYQQINIPCGLDLLVYTPQEIKNMLSRGNPFIRQVVKEGKILYEK